MRSTLILIFFLSFNQIVFSQTDFQQKVSSLVKYIERNLKYEMDANDDPVADFFVYDISIDSVGKISSIHTIIWDSLAGKRQVVQLADSLKANIKFHNAAFKKLFIPVLVVYENGSEHFKKDTAPMLETIKLFGMLKRQQKQGVYVAEMATVIGVSSSVRVRE